MEGCARLSLRMYDRDEAVGDHAVDGFGESVLLPSESESDEVRYPCISHFGATAS